MKKHRKLLVGLTLTVGLLIVGTGVVLARGIQHETTPVGPNSDFTETDQGVWSHMHGFGRRKESETGFPLMLDAMVDALMDVTGLTEDEILGEVEEGRNLVEIAFAAGLVNEEFFEVMDAIHGDIVLNEDELWGEYHPHMWQFGSRFETNKIDDFSAPCFKGADSGISMSDNISQDQNW